MAGAKRGGREWERIYRNAGLAVIPLLCALPVVLGFIVGLIDDFGRQFSPAFFSVVAEGLLPVLLVSAVVQSALFARRQLEHESSKLMERTLLSNALAIAGVFVVGEAIALYAVATETASTFLVVAPLVAAVQLLFEIVFLTYYQYAESVAWLLPSRVTKRFAARERALRIRQADALEERARQLRSLVDGDASDSDDRTAD